MGQRTHKAEAPPQGPCRASPPPRAGRRAGGAGTWGSWACMRKSWSSSCAAPLRSAGSMSSVARRKSRKAGDHCSGSCRPGPRGPVSRGPGGQRGGGAVSLALGIRLVCGVNRDNDVKGLGAGAAWTAAQSRVARPCTLYPSV